MPEQPKPRFFATPDAFGKWLAVNHAKKSELVVGYWKVGTGKPSLTWAQSVEQALRYGWIDGVRRSLDEESYCIRFTPRKAGSHWSNVNVRTAERLVAEKAMMPAGVQAFQARSAARTGAAAFEQGEVKMPPALLKAFKADAKAWSHFSQRPAWYQKAATWWVVSAKREETTAKRFAELMAASRQGLAIRQFDRTGQAKTRQLAGKSA